MSQFKREEYDKYKRDFDLVIKKILNYETRSLPTESDKRDERIVQYKCELVAVYNALIKYIGTFFNTFDHESKTALRGKIGNWKLSVLRALAILGLSVDLPENFELIDIEKIISADQIETLNDSATGSTVFLSGENLNRNTVESNSLTGNEILNRPAETMVQSFIEFLNIATKLINYKYDGDPLSLSTFLNKVELLEAATEQPNKEHLVKYVKSCLEGKAIEALPPNVNTLQEIIDALKAEIKFDSSKVIEGKLMALKADHTRLNEYAKKAEELALALKRALVLEEFPPKKANEMVVAKTIELCRSNSRSTLVRGILGSAKFENAEEVIAKYIVESRTETTENQILAFKQQNSRSNGHKNFRGNNNNFRTNQSQNNNYNQSNNNYNNGGNFRGNSRGNSRGNFRNNFRGNYRGRGRGGYQNYQGDERNVRVLENQSAPPSGASQNVNANQAEQY